MKKLYTMLVQGSLVLGLLTFMVACGSGSSNNTNNCNNGQVWSAQYNSCLNTCPYAGGQGVQTPNAGCQANLGVGTGNCTGLPPQYAQYSVPTTVIGQPACCIPGAPPVQQYCLPQNCQEMGRQGTFPNCF